MKVLAKYKLSRKLIIIYTEWLKKCQHFYEMILNSFHLFIIPVNTFLESSIMIQNNGTPSIRVPLLVKQNWHFGDRLRKIPRMCQ